MNNLIKIGSIFFFLLFFGPVRYASGTCALESDFGFTLDCNFKKSGLFRVKNLGGLKGYINIGLSFGDELGFSESLGNLEGGRRRALNHRDLNIIGTFPAKEYMRSLSNETSNQKNQIKIETAKTLETDMTDASSLPLGVPAFRPIPDTSHDVERWSDNANNIKSLHRISNDHNRTIGKENLATGDEYVGLQKVTRSIYEEQLQPSRYKNENKTVGLTELQTTIIDSRHISLRKSNEKDAGVFKVMNAPKEYYPSGYEKNYDDNFKSKVELPLTNFVCKNQLHFPGLYADVYLNCMVFHVCALTDEGIVRKSFLCPESTLFDQTILKCNWWFYVNCQKSQNIYDSNIPISMSYQLMKSWSYFSKHNSNSSIVLAK